MKAETRVTIQRRNSLYGWTDIAYPGEDPENIKEALELCKKEEANKRYKKPLRVLKTTYEVLQYE